MNMIGKRIRVHSLVGEPKQVNDRYAGREGVIGYIDDIGQYHIIWDGATEIGGLAVIPGEDDYELLESKKTRQINGLNENINSYDLIGARIKIIKSESGPEYVNKIATITDIDDEIWDDDIFLCLVCKVKWDDDSLADDTVCIGDAYDSKRPDSESQVMFIDPEHAHFNEEGAIYSYAERSHAEDMYVAAEHYASLREGKASAYKKYYNLTEAKGLTPEEKMERWHLGTRKENIKACSDEKLVEYRKICRAKGYTEQVKLINAEIKSRKSDKSKPVNEAFENNRLTNLIADHGGLDKRQRRWDARTYATDVDISRSTVSGFIPARAMDYIYMLDPYKPLNTQILYCNDGGAIIIKNNDERYDSPYAKKVEARNRNAFKDFELETGRKHSWEPFNGMSKWVTQGRRLREPLKEE